MDKTLWAILVTCTVLLGLVYFADGQGNFIGGGYPNGGGFPGRPGGGGFPGYPGGGGFPGYPGGGGYPGYPGGGGHCQCRRYCWRGERYAGRCYRPWRRPFRRHFRRRLVRCCPIYGPFGR
ncbi:translation initiation factor IF-2-like [Mercenaria mercenaria]|uniref:translation initiation factor IF-2-like n=1 Tax=Mercenaria mercenaria TaxID=6596 RepID=UPI00234E69C3|nr:translation initiation factor IF-2-like [Mercenaria mercenaria]